MGNVRGVFDKKMNDGLIDSDKDWIMPLNALLVGLKKDNMTINKKYKPYRNAYIVFLLYTFFLKEYGEKNKVNKGCKVALIQKHLDRHFRKPHKYAHIQKFLHLLCKYKVIQIARVYSGGKSCLIIQMGQKERLMFAYKICKNIIDSYKYML